MISRKCSKKTELFVGSGKKSEVNNMRNIRHVFLSSVILLAVTAALFTVVGAAAAKATADLTDTWTSDEGGGGIYYLTQIGSTLWWYGEGDPNSPGWSNVARGTISGNTITMTWADVPKGQTRNHGSMKLQIVSDNELKVISQTGGAGLKYLRR